MKNNFDNWKNLTDKELQLIIQNVTKLINDSELSRIKNDLDSIWRIILSKECVLNVKLRYGYSMFLGIIKHNYPFSMEDVLRKDIINIVLNDQECVINDEVIVTLLSGVIDCKPQTLIFPVILETQDKILSKMDLLFCLFHKLCNNNSKEYYHMALLMKRIWDLVERDYKDGSISPSLNDIEICVRFFLQLLDSSICGLPTIICDIFAAILKWSLESERNDIISFFNDHLLSEFFPSDISTYLSYPLCKINLRFLKFMIRALGPKHVLQKIPLLFDYLVQSSAVNYTASLAGDVFAATVIKLNFDDYVSREALFRVVIEYMIHGCDKLWYEDSSHELLALNFAQFSIPPLVERCLDDLMNINIALLTRLNTDINWDKRCHCLFFWVSSFVHVYAQTKSITDNEAKCLLNCLSHINDKIRITAYKFVCDNYDQEFQQNAGISLAIILDICANNLTSDNPSFRNHFISATKRLLISVRDSVIARLGDSQLLTADIDRAMKNTLFSGETVMYLESVSWINIIEEIGNIKYKDIVVFLMFCRHVYCNQWFHPSMNYQRQKSMSDLIRSIRDIIVDPNFFIDKKSGFSAKTVTDMREFYQDIINKHFANVNSSIRTFVDSLLISKSDIQCTFYGLLSNTNRDYPYLTSNYVDHHKLWSLSQQLCHSNQPIQLSSGSFLVGFLWQSGFKPDNYQSVSDYLVCFLEELSMVDMSSVLNMALKRPGHGYLLAMDLLLKESAKTEDLLKSDRVAIAAIKVIDIMMRIMGSDQQDEMASFHKLGVTITSLASSSTNISSASIGMLAEYQHVLSWSWQILRMASTILVNWCRAVDKERDSVLIHDTGLVLLRIMFHSRHRGTIESVAGSLQTYIHIGETSSSHKHSWITARQVAITQCIDGAVRGSHSITRRSAGLPLVLMAALSASHTSIDGRNLAIECLQQLLLLMSQSTDATQSHSSSLVDPAIVHYLNLTRHMCQNPGLVLPLQRHYGQVLLVALGNFSSSHWGVRNAALQLFTFLVSRLAALTRINPTYGELFSLYPELWQPLLDIVQQGAQPSKSFTKHKTLVPALTLLANVQNCHDNHLPVGMSISQLRQCLWPLLANEVVTVRRLAAKCIIRSLPNSRSSIEIISHNTSLIPRLLSSNQSQSLPTHLFPFSQQHGELFLLNLITKNLALQMTPRDISLTTLLHHCQYSIDRKCWIVVQSFVNVFLSMVLPPADSTGIANIIARHILNLLNENPRPSDLGREDAIVSMLRLVVRLDSTMMPDLVTHLLSLPNADVLQHLCASDIAFSDIFTGSISLLCDRLCVSLHQYEAHYTPYLVKIFVRVMRHHHNEIHSMDQHSLIVLCDLVMATLDSGPTESVLLSCMDLLTFILVMLQTSLSQTVIVCWLSHIERYLKADVPENNRLCAAKNFSVMMASSHSNDIIVTLAPRLALMYTVGCYDECRVVRDDIRQSLLCLVASDPGIVVSGRHLVLLYHHLCHQSGHSLHSLLTYMWQQMVASHEHCQRQIVSSRTKDALYEPVAANIYIEDALILETFYEQWCTQKSNDRDIVASLCQIHRCDDLDDYCDIDCPAFVLTTSRHLINKLQSTMYLF